MSTVKVTNLQHPSSASPNIVLDSSGNATMAGSMAMATPFAMKNKIINGAMEIDQRNAGASVTIGANANTYTLDRWIAYGSLGSKISVQQNAGSVTTPAGFKNYLGVTSLAATSVGASEQYVLVQAIEGLNVVDLAWGTASAKTITLSFWVRSSLTGTFGGTVRNYTVDRTYVFSYSISSANTWEQKTITIPGDTSGTWLTTNSVGLYLTLGLGVGSSLVTSAGTWLGTNYVSVTGQTSVVGTNGATFYLTGVQFEVGTVATPFERRLYPQELAMCQRYYEKSYESSVAPGSVANANSVYWYNGQTGSSALLQVSYKVTKRTGPTITQYSPVTGTSGVVRNRSSGTDVTGYTMYAGDGAFVGGTNAAGAIAFYDFQWTASAEL